MIDTSVVIMPLVNHYSPFIVQRNGFMKENCTLETIMYEKELTLSSAFLYHHSILIQVFRTCPSEVRYSRNSHAALSKARQGR